MTTTEERARRIETENERERDREDLTSKQREREDLGIDTAELLLVVGHKLLSVMLRFYQLPHLN